MHACKRVCAEGQQGFRPRTISTVCSGSAELRWAHCGLVAELLSDTSKVRMVPQVGGQRGLNSSGCNISAEGFRSGGMNNQKCITYASLLNIWLGCQVQCR